MCPWGPDIVLAGRTRSLYRVISWLSLDMVIGSLCKRPNFDISWMRISYHASRNSGHNITGRYTQIYEGSAGTKPRRRSSVQRKCSLNRPPIHTVIHQLLRAQSSDGSEMDSDQCHHCTYYLRRVMVVLQTKEVFRLFLRDILAALRCIDRCHNGYQNHQSTTQLGSLNWFIYKVSRISRSVIQVCIEACERCWSGQWFECSGPPGGTDGIDSRRPLRRYMTNAMVPLMRNGPFSNPSPRTRICIIV